MEQKATLQVAVAFYSWRSGMRLTPLLVLIERERKRISGKSSYYRGVRVEHLSSRQNANGHPVVDGRCAFFLEGTIFPYIVLHLEFDRKAGSPLGAFFFYRDGVLYCKPVQHIMHLTR